MRSEKYKVKRCTYIDEKIYYLVPSEDIERKLNISQLEQDVLLENLQKAGMIKIEIGYDGKKYVLLCKR